MHSSICIWVCPCISFEVVVRRRKEQSKNRTSYRSTVQRYNFFRKNKTFQRKISNTGTFFICKLYTNVRWPCCRVFPATCLSAYKSTPPAAPPKRRQADYTPLPATKLNGACRYRRCGFLGCFEILERILKKGGTFLIVTRHQTQKFSREFLSMSTDDNKDTAKHYPVWCRLRYLFV